MKKKEWLKVQNEVVVVFVVKASFWNFRLTFSNFTPDFQNYYRNNFECYYRSGKRIKPQSPLVKSGLGVKHRPVYCLGHFGRTLVWTMVWNSSGQWSDTCLIRGHLSPELV